MDSKDKRTKRQKLQDMANQSVSPEEAEIARKKLEKLPSEEPVSFDPGKIYINGFEAGDLKDFEIKFEVNMVYEQDGGGYYDFVNQKWVWFDSKK